jgi:hypothetical protein
VARARSWSRLWVMSLLTIVMGTRALSAQTVVDHRAYDALLHAHVKDGLVDYDAFAKAPEFRSYLASLDKVDASKLDDQERLAFWLNVYNAYTIQLIVAHGERQSIRNVNKTLGVLQLKGPWSEPLVRAAGKRLTLDEVEHRIIRREFHDPRVHFAMTSAARGSPPLRNEAYTGALLERQLVDQGRIFLRESPLRNSIQGRGLVLSPIFTHFRADFGVSRAELVNFLRPWLDDSVRVQLEKGRFFLVEKKFDWTLNAPWTKPDPTVTPIVPRRAAGTDTVR